MTWIANALTRRPLFLVPLICLAIAGCDGTESRKQVNDTVKELSGRKNLDRMDQMKKDIADINKQQTDRLKEPQ